MLRVIIIARDGRGARNLGLSALRLALALLLAVSAASCVLWLGWKLAEWSRLL